MEPRGSATWPVQPGGSGRALREPAEIQWSRGATSDIDGQTGRTNGAFGKVTLQPAATTEPMSQDRQQMSANPF